MIIHVESREVAMAALEAVIVLCHGGTQGEIKGGKRREKRRKCWRR